MLRRTRMVLAVLLMLCSVINPTGRVQAAVDDVVGTRYEEAVMYLYGLGVVKGRPEGFFPDHAIGRDEAVKIIVEILGKGSMAQALHGARTFGDVPSTHWASGYIAVARSLNIVGGFPDGTFRPSDPVTYAQYAKMLVEAAGLSPIPSLSWPHNYVDVAHSQGLLNAMPSFSPDRPAVRGDCAVMTARAVRQIPDPRTGRTLSQAVFGEQRATRLTISAENQTVRANSHLKLTVRAWDGDGKELSGFTPTFETTPSPDAQVSESGVFTASAPGSYTVSARVDGATDSTVITVYGVPASLRATPPQQTLRANGTSTAVVTVEVLDSLGNRVLDAKDQVTVAYDKERGAVALPEIKAKAAATGVVSFEVQVGTVTGVTDVLVFSAGSLAKAYATLTATGPTPTAVVVTATPPELTANVPTAGLVTAVVVDQDGRPMTTGEYDITFVVQGRGTLESGAASVTVRTLGQRASVAVVSTPGQAGSISVNATSPNLRGGSATITTHLGGAPARLKVLPASVTGRAGDAGGMRVAISLADSSGRPTTADRDYSVELVAPAGSGLVGLVPLTYSAAAEDSVQVLDIWGTVAGTYQVTVREAAETPTLSSASFQVVVRPGEPTQIAVTPKGDPPVYLPAADPRVTLRAQLQDAYGNDVALPGVELEYKTTAGAGAVSWSAVGGKVRTGPDGSASVLMTAKGGVGSSYRVTVGADLDGNGTHTDAIGQTAEAGIVVSEQAPASISLSLSNAAGDVISRLAANAGDWAHVEMQVRDDQGRTVPAGYAVELRLSNDGVNVLPGSWLDTGLDNGVDLSRAGSGVVLALTNTDGRVTLAFQAAQAGGCAVVARALNAGTSVSRALSFHVDPGRPIGAAIYRNDWSLASGVDVQPGTARELRVAPVDHGRNRLPTPGAMLVRLAADRPTGEYRATADGPALDWLEIPAGAAHVVVYYVDSHYGQGLDLSDDVTDVLAYGLSVGWDEDSGMVVATVTDGLGQPLGGVRVTLSRQAGDGTFAGGLVTVTGVTGAAGTFGVAYVDGDAPGEEQVRGWLPGCRNLVGGARVEVEADSGVFEP